MKNKNLNAFFLFLLSLILVGKCSSMPAHLSNRGLDLADTADITVVPCVIGASGQFGDNSVGFFTDFGMAAKGLGLKAGEFGLHRNFPGSAVIVDMRYHQVHSEDPEVNRRVLYRQKEFISKVMIEGTIYPPSKASYTRIGIAGGALLCAEIAFNPGELADFFIGFFRYDIYNDDYYKTIGEPNK